MKIWQIAQAPPSPPLYVASSAEVEFGAGFHEEEHDGQQRFRWMGGQSTLLWAPAAGPRHLELRVFSEFHDLSQQLRVTSGDGRPAVLFDGPLVHGWCALSLPVPGGIDRLALHVNKIFPREYYPADRRTLGIRIQTPRLHEDEVRHAAIAAQHANAVANVEEMRAGRTELQSTPPSLGIDLHGVCNVKPPCVYCEWDASKDLE